MKKIKFITLLAITLITVFSCKKSKIDKNLDGTWNLSELVIDNNNQVTNTTLVLLEFSAVSKGEGSVGIIFHSSTSTNKSVGTVTIDKKYKTMRAVILNQGNNHTYEGEFNVDKTNFELDGTFTDANGTSHSLRIRGTKLNDEVFLL